MNYSTGPLAYMIVCFFLELEHFVFIFILSIVLRFIFRAVDFSVIVTEFSLCKLQYEDFSILIFTGTVYQHPYTFENKSDLIFNRRT